MRLAIIICFAGVFFGGFGAGAFTAMAQPGAGSIEGVVTDSATQGPVSKAQVTLLPRGGFVMGSASSGGSSLLGASASRASISSPAGVTAANRFGSAQGRVMLDPILSGGSGLRSIPGGFGPGGPATASTDASGNFAFRDLAPGRYGVQVFHARYPMRTGGPVTSEVEVKSGEAARVTVSLAPGASISGRFTDEDGDPLPGCNAQVRSPNSTLYGMPGMGMEPSNERGEYRVWGLNSGKYVVYAQCMRPIFQPRPFSAGPPPPATAGYPPQFYPQASDAVSASVIELTPGSERTGVDFQMKPARVYSVYGMVSGMERSDSHQVSVMLTNPKERFGMGVRGGRVDPATGAFEIQNVFPGSYVLVANQQIVGPGGQPPGGNAMGARQLVEVADRSVQTNVLLQRASDIPGTLVVDTDKPFPVQQVNIQFMSDEPMSGMAPRVELQADGSFVAKNVGPGVWRVNVFGPNVFIRSLEVGGQTIESRTLDTSKGTAGPLRIVVSTKTATVQGKGTPGISYLFIEEDAAANRFVQQRMGVGTPQGGIEVQGLPPGRHRVYEGNAADETAYLQTVTLSEGTVTTVDLSKRPTGAPTNAR